MIQVLFSNILRITMICSIGICIILLLKKTLFKEYNKSFNYYIWLIVIFRMIFPFEIPIYLNSKLVINKLSVLNTLNTNNINNANISQTSLSSSLHVNNFYTTSNNFNISFFEILSYLWIIIALIIVAYRSFSYLKFKKTLLDLSLPVEDQKINFIYSELLTELKIKKDILLKISDHTSVPLGIGILNSSIILPKINYTETEIKWILRHELMHYKQRDLIYKFLVMIVASIYWFNPLIYVMNKYINIECELSCDEKTLHKYNFSERKEYALTLLNSLKQSQAKLLRSRLTTELGNKEILKRRFESMLNKKTKRGIFFAVLAIGITICSLGTFSTKADSNVINENQESSETVADKNQIEAFQIESQKYKGYYLLIKDPTRVKIGHTSKLMSEGETVSEIAKNSNAIAAINGGSFSAQRLDGSKTNGTPTGIVISDGKLLCNPIKEEYVNGKYISREIKTDEKIDLFAINKHGQLIVGKYSINDLSALDAQEALSFGPALIINGKKADLSETEKADILPRSAIGQKKDGTIIMLVIDALDGKHRGASIQEVQDILYILGAVNAINLPGTGAQTMYYNNEVINKPISMLDLHTDTEISSLDLREMKLPTAIIVK